MLVIPSKNPACNKKNGVLSTLIVISECVQASNNNHYPSLMDGNQLQDSNTSYIRPQIYEKEKMH